MSFGYTKDDYLIEVSMSSRLRILAEGVDDRIFIEDLIDGLEKIRNCSSKPHAIDCACNLIGFKTTTGHGNRVLIEEIHAEAILRGFGHKLICFSDREYRGFLIGDPIVDVINTHYQCDTLTWTRGHSIENYFFSKTIIREVLLSLSSSEARKEAANTIYNNFEDIVVTIATLSITSLDLGLETLPQSVLNESHFYFSNDNICFNVVNFCKSLDNQFKNSSYNFSNFPITFYEWKKVIKETSQGTLINIIRGHTGIACILTVYSACINYYCSKNGKRIKAHGKNQIGFNLFFQQLSSRWSKLLHMPGVEYPTTFEALIF